MEQGSFKYPNNSANLPVLTHLYLCNVAWESMVAKLFGLDALEHIDNFGRYLVLRQQRIYFSNSTDGRPDYKNIYKDRCRKFYTHNYFDFAHPANE